MTNHRKYSSGFINASSRFASILLILLVIIASMFGGTIITSLAQGESPDPVRYLHKVKIGDKSYCFFVEKNVVLTPSEIAKKENGEPRTDEELTALILEKAGLYMKEPNCNESSHSRITFADWTKDKGSFSLSKADLESLRGAAPKDGSTVKLYIDPLISTEKASKPAAPSVISPTAATTPTEPAEGSTDTNGESTNPSGESTDPATDPSDPSSGSTDPATDPSDPSGGSTDPATDPSDPSGGSTDPATDPSDPSGGSTDPATDPTDPSGGSTDPATDPTDPSSGSADPVVPPVPVPEEITWYPVSALTSPSLLFVVVATEKDSKYVEEICEAKKEASKEETTAETTVQPQTVAPVKKPKTPKAVTPPEETLPEFKTIKMYDRSGGPLEETLKDGDPVTLTWITPKGNSTSKKSFFDRIPGGVLGLAAIAAAVGFIAFAIVKRKKSSEEEQ